MKKALTIFLLLLGFTVRAQILTCPFGPSFDSILASDTMHMRSTIARSELLHNYNSATISTQSTSPLIIPVVVHVIHPNTQSVGQGINMSYAQIKSQIDRLNADFANDTLYTQLPSGQYAANVGIQFCLATEVMGPSQWTDTTEPGVMRYGVAPSNVTVLNQIYNSSNFTTANAMVALTHPNSSFFPYENYLNIWTVNQITDGGTTQIAGFAPTPLGNFSGNPIDGIVMDAHMFGDNTVNNNNFPNINPSYNTGNILAHEAGHYMALWHVFFGGCTGNTLATCQTSGDFICDTPPSNSQSSSCNSVNTCNESYFTTGPADHPDMIENYMMYSDDNCFNTFTAEQGLVMRNYLQVYRSTLISATNLSLTGVASPSGCLPPQLLATITTPLQICVNVADTFFTPTGPGFTAVSWIWQFAGGTPSTSAAQNPVVSWTTSGQHLIILTAYDAFNNSVQDSIEIYVSPCASLASDQGVWYFGSRAGLNFSSGVAVRDDQAAANNTMWSGEGCVSIADSAGALVYYSNGVTVWDRNHVAAITGLNGDPQTSKSQIISVPHPLHKNWYYLFTSPSYGQYYSPIYYSIVADSNGTMIPISLNDSLPTPPGCLLVGEAITAVPHCNGRDFWVITRGSHWIANSTDIWTQRLLVYLISPAGITNPSGVGQLPYIYTFPSGGSSVVGMIKGSPDNKHLVVTHNFGVASIVDFDNSTGIISNERSFTSPSGSYHGCSFSPDSRTVYVGNLTTSTIYGVDITQPILTPVLLTSTVNWPGSFQLGPDSMLYVSRVGSNYASRFTNPNNLSSPGYVQQAIQLDVVYNTVGEIYGLPNMIDGIIPARAPLSFNVTFNNCSTAVCVPNGCWGTSYNYSWDFGDNTPIDTNAIVTHVYAASGQYTITLVISIGNYSYPPIQQPIAVLLTAPSISGPASTCVSQYNYTTYSVPSGAQNYQWLVAGGGTIVGLDTLAYCNVSWSSSGLLTCIVNNGAGCTFTTSVVVTVHPNPTADAGADTAYSCPGGYFQIGGNPTAAGGTGPYTYQWFPSSSVLSPNASNPVVIVSGPSTYTVAVTDSYGCASSDLIFVDIDSSLTAPPISFSSAPQSCDNGSSISLTPLALPSGGVFSGTAVAGTSFDPSLVSAPDSSIVYYLYTDTTTGCASFDSTFIYVYSCCDSALGINTINGQTSSSFGSQFNSVPVPVHINGTFVIDNTFYITNYNFANTVFCASDAVIRVRAGGHLIIQQNSVLKACEDMWKGIVVEPGGELHILTNSIIADAQQAVVSQNGAKFTLDRALLRDNYQNVIVEPYTGSGLHQGTIVRSKIQGANLTLAPYAGFKTFSGMEITGVDSIYVGVPTTVSDENEFRGMDLGIITSHSNVYVRNNQFNGITSTQVMALPACCLVGNCGPNVNCNPAPKGTAIWATANNVIIGGPTVSYQNRFTSCTRGILAEDTINARIENNKFISIATTNTLIQSNCVEVRTCYMNSEIITDNIMYSCLNGIVFGFSNQTSALIERNDLDKMKGTSIQVTQTTECPVSIGFNTVNATATANGKYGIRVANAVVTNSTPYIEIHGNITKMVDKHIWVTNFPYIVVDSSNNMQFVNGVPTTTQYGIQVQNSHDALVDGNTVTKNGAVPTDTNYRKRLYGISMETNCYNTQVSNNGLFKVGTGVQYFNSNNYPSSISCNNFFNDMRGVLFTNAYIGDQGAPISSSNPNGIAQDNQWTITGTQAAVYKSIWAENSPSNTWYYRSSTSTYFPPLITHYPQLGYFTFTGPLSNAPSSCVQPCPTCRAQSDLAALVDGEVTNDSTGEATRFITDQSVYAQLLQNDSLMMMGTEYDSVLVNFFMEKAGENVGHINEAYTMASAGDISGASAAKDGITPSGNPDMNHKIVLEIYLRSWAAGQLEFTPEDSAALYAVAYQNVTNGGTAVYDARVMLDLDIDDLHSSSGARLAVDSAQNSPVGYLYPNPTAGIAIYETTLGEAESGYIVITDVFGRPLIQQPLKPGFNQAEVNLAGLPSGIYLYKAVIDDEVRQTGKVVLNK